jgi:hypothetical protein
VLRWFLRSASAKVPPFQESEWGLIAPRWPSVQVSKAPAHHEPPCPVRELALTPPGLSCRRGELGLDSPPILGAKWVEGPSHRAVDE